MRIRRGTTGGRAVAAAAVVLALLGPGGACKGAKPGGEGGTGAPAGGQRQTAEAPAPGSPPVAAPPAAPAPPPAVGAVAALPPVVEPERKASLPSVPGPGAVAVVNGEEISDRTFADDLAAVSFFAKHTTEQGRREVLDGRIGFLLQVQDAKRLGFPERPAVKRALARMRRRYQAAAGRKEILREAVKLPEEEVAARLAKLEALPPTMDLTVILVESRADAEKALARVRAGEDMEAVARQVSISPGASAGNARRMGVRGGSGMYPADVEAAIATLAAGEISAPLETPVGFLVVRLDGRHERTEEDRRKDRQGVEETLAMERNAALTREIVERAAPTQKPRVILARIADAPLPDPAGHGVAVWRALDGMQLAEVDGGTITFGDVFLDVSDYFRFVRKNKEGWQEWYERQLERLFEEAAVAAHARAKAPESLPAIEEAVSAVVPNLLAGEYGADIILAQGTLENVDDAAARAFFEGRKEKFPAPELLHAAQILVRRESEAREVRQRLGAGGNFMALAKEFSVDASAARGGDLGPLTAPELDRIWGREMTGEVTARARRNERGPFTLRSTAGYHVVLVRDYAPAGSGRYEAVRQKVREAYLQHLQTTSVAERVAALRAVAAIGIDARKLASIEPTPSATGQPSPHRPKAGTAGPAPHGAVGGAKGPSPHGGASHGF